MATTSSFRELDLQWREELSRLHDDYFYGQRSEAIWRDHALRTLPVLQDATDMLVCGEDLGMIPGCVHPVMQELGIIGECLLCGRCRGTVRPLQHFYTTPWRLLRPSCTG